MAREGLRWSFGHVKEADAVDKFFSHLAVDATLDQLLVCLIPEEVAGEIRALAWFVVMTIQLLLVRRWVLSWAGLDAETQIASLETVAA